MFCIKKNYETHNAPSTNASDEDEFDHGTLNNRAPQSLLDLDRTDQHEEVLRADYGTASSSSTTQRPSRQNQSWRGNWQNSWWEPSTISLWRRGRVSTLRSRKSDAPPQLIRDHSQDRNDVGSEGVSEEDETLPLVLLSRRGLLVCNAAPEELGQANPMDGVY